MSARAELKPAYFDDQDLKRFENKNESGLILIVSDGMPYSEMSVGPVVAEAKKRHLALIILSDRAGPNQKKRGNAIVKSNRLLSKGAMRHFPSLFIVKKHALLNQVIPGFQTPSELHLNLNEALR